MRNFILLHKKAKLYILLSLSLSLGLLFCARILPGFGQFYATRIFPAISGVLGRIFSPLPFSVFEASLFLAIIALGAFLLCALFLLAKRNGRKRLGKLCPKVFLTATCFLTTLLLIFTLTCGINYSRDGFAKDANLAVAPSSNEDLIRLSHILIADLTVLAGPSATDKAQDFSAVEQECRVAMKALGRTYPTLSGYYPNPKEMFFSTGMSYLNLSGIFSPFTMEANYNCHMPDYLIPFTICHELSHLKGYVMEEDAGFIGYLACVDSKDPKLRYSAALQGLSYTLSALYKNSTPEEYRKTLGKVPPKALGDLQINQAYWNKYHGKAAAFSHMANDAYLKVNAQADGVKSYGRMVDLLLAYYKLNARLL